jgi:hypothetical protein
MGRASPLKFYLKCVFKILFKMADAQTPQLALTTVAEPKDCDGKRLYPVNVGWGGKLHHYDKV